MQAGSHPTFVEYSDLLHSSYLAAAERVAGELKASRQDSGLLYFGPQWVIASHFLQQLLWSSAWLQGIASRQSSADSGKKGKESKSTAKASNGDAAALGGKLVGAASAEVLQCVSSLQKAITDAARLIQVHPSREVPPDQLTHALSVLFPGLWSVDFCSAFQAADSWSSGP